MSNDLSTFSNDLATLEQGQMDTEALKRLTEKKWLDNIQLLADLSQLVQNPPPYLTERPQAGEFWLGGDTRLGHVEKNRIGKLEYAYFDFIPLATRFHASVVENKELVEEVFDSESPAYLRIEAESRGRSTNPNRQARCGIDVCMWIPDIQRFGVYFFAKTAIAEGQLILAQMASDAEEGRSGTVYRLTSYIKSNKANSWWMPKFTPSPLRNDTVALPRIEDARKKVTDFLTQKPREKQGSMTPGVDR